ncbi:hypothetical protein FOXYSP1_05760 [Fusarium oxysporum f. sp. phaseoli]
MAVSYYVREFILDMDHSTNIAATSLPSIYTHFKRWMLYDSSASRKPLWIQSFIHISAKLFVSLTDGEILEDMGEVEE